MSEACCETVVGIVSPGEMGAALGRVIADNGFRAVTTLAGRSSRTQKHCVDAGLQILESFEQVALLSDVFIALVPPCSARSVAELYITHAHCRRRPTTYVDANSISPQTARQVSDIVSRANIRFVDASIHGQAAHLRENGTVYVSGCAAGNVAALFANVVRVEALGDEAGRASAMKMLMGGVSKGLVALFLEMSLVAHEAGLVDQFMEECRNFYPGIMSAIDRLLPTYPRHAVRRGDEMRELERTIMSLGLRPSMIRGARRTIASLGELFSDDRRRPDDSAPWSVGDVVAQVCGANPLRESFEAQRDLIGCGA